ncbi:MAG: DUF4905 domain-containing protein [Cytophagales bacterium]|nr:DUF4905 domain-containing protein [Cytophagales bacterium]
MAKKIARLRFDGQIWKICFDDSSRRLALEVKASQRLETIYHTVGLDGELAGKPVLPRENWWTGLSGFHRGCLLVHTYEGASNPRIKNLAAFDAQSGKEVWEADDFVAAGCAGGCVLGYVLEEQQPFYGKIELSTGAYEELSASEQEAMLAGEKSAFCLPSHFEEATEYFQLIQRFFREKRGQEIAGAVDYYENKTHIFISYYKKGNISENWLTVLTYQGEMILDEKIQESGEGLALDSFFVCCGILGWIEDKNTLCLFSV